MPLQPGKVIHNRYRVIALVHQGGMGAVYETVDTTLNVHCAVKELVPYPGTMGTALPELREQFRQEARLLAELRQPHLPRVTDHFEEDGNAYLVMDFIYGKRLDQVIAQEGSIREEQVLVWARELFDALAHCHRQGVIHRDVKPQNVMITPGGRAILVDFGLAKLMDPDDPHTRTVMRGLGTPEYAPPEQYDARKGNTDVRTDVYSLGATLYHALAGMAPPTVTERIVDPKCLIPLRQIRRDVSTETEQVLKKAMSLQPAQRFQSIDKMYEALLGQPPIEAQAAITEPLDSEMDVPEESTPETVLLSRTPLTRLWVRRWLGVALAIIGMVSLATITPLVAGRINASDAPTEMSIPVVVSTMTPTHTPTATPSATPTFTASPTSTPRSVRRTRMPRTSDWPYLLDVASPTASQTLTPTHTPSPTYTIALPTFTPSPVLVTDTPPPPPSEPEDRPRPEPTAVPTQPPPPPTEAPTQPPPPPTEAPTQAPEPTQPRDTPSPG
jgi:serine/threonine protein kinase